jgi:hypothetical protein
MDANRNLIFKEEFLDELLEIQEAGERNLLVEFMIS